jgi:hypothetical protein
VRANTIDNRCSIVVFVLNETFEQVAKVHGRINQSRRLYTEAFEVTLNGA